MLNLIKFVTRGYLAAAVIFSFMHLIHAAEKAGGTVPEAIATPFLIDGLFLMAMVMRGKASSTRTRKIGLYVQVIAGTLSIVGNAYAAHTLFSACFGAMLPVLVVGAEWLSDPRQMKSAETEQAEHDAAVRETNKIAGQAKAQATRARKKATADETVRAAERLTRQAAARHRSTASA